MVSPRKPTVSPNRIKSSDAIYEDGSLEQKRKQNRERMPEFTAFYDEVVRVFGEAKVICASENGFKVGRKLPSA